MSVWNAYDQVTEGREGWANQLADWRATIAVVEAQNPALTARLSGIGWQAIYTDADGSILLAPGR